MPDIPVTELARRICIANHPLYGQTGPAARVPCGEHIRAANLAYSLTLESGRKTLLAVVKAAGLLDDLRETYYAVPAGSPTTEQLEATLPALYDAVEQLVGEHAGPWVLRQRADGHEIEGAPV